MIHSVNLDAKIAHVPDTDARQHRRRLVNFAASLADAAAEALEIKVTDLSEGGVRIRLEGALAPGDPVWIKLPGLEARRATIRWRIGEEAGCQFDTVLDEGAMRTLFDHVRLSRRPTPPRPRLFHPPVHDRG